MTHHYTELSVVVNFFFIFIDLILLEIIEKYQHTFMFAKITFINNCWFT